MKVRMVHLNIPDKRVKRYNLVIGHLDNNVKIANIYILTHHISNYPK